MCTYQLFCAGPLCTRLLALWCCILRHAKSGSHPNQNLCLIMDWPRKANENRKQLCFTLSNAVNLLRELKYCTQNQDDSFILKSLTEVKDIMEFAQRGGMSQQAELQKLSSVVRELNDYVQIIAITKLYRDMNRVKDFLSGVSSWIHYQTDKPQSSHRRTSYDTGICCIRRNI